MDLPVNARRRPLVWDVCHKPFGVVFISERSPKVGVPRQPGLEDTIPLGLVAPELDLISSRRDPSFCRPRIPTGIRPKAQDCEARATLGQRPSNMINPNGVATDIAGSVAMP